MASPMLVINIAELDVAPPLNVCRYILRNYMAQNAIAAAETGDYSEVRRVLKLLQRPYDDADDDDAVGGASAPYDAKPPEWAAALRITLSE